MAIELSYIFESNIKKYKDEKSLQETGIVIGSIGSFPQSQLEG